MKKVTLAIAMAALVLFAGCKKDTETKGTVLKASIEQNQGDSKTSLNPSNGTNRLFAKKTTNNLTVELNTVKKMGELEVFHNSFTVGNGQRVMFAPGNLQYIGSAATPYWKFADNQWDLLPNTDQFSNSENIDRDRFGWGTSGYDHGATCYQPWSTGSEANYYAYGDATKDLQDAKDDGSMQGMADWGYNAIQNGGNQENSGWRTLTKNEWVSVFNTRSTAEGIRWARATVAGVQGYILLPDNWTTAIYELTNPNGGNYASNTFTDEEWNETFEPNHAVFLPNTRGAIYGPGILYPNDSFYWSDTHYSGNLRSSQDLYLGNSGNIGSDKSNRSAKMAVRLVRNAE